MNKLKKPKINLLKKKEKKTDDEETSKKKETKTAKEGEVPQTEPRVENIDDGNETGKKKNKDKKEKNRRRR